ncbi:LuxR C-terminal-related transcriptional regulator [Enterobacter bugandensis]|uniref:LuxR C-terminal-related transcriptional regulator n=1 Tax=Enterobacter bugandensis TaxID=881260 RepID=UPI0021D1DFDC|nr:LuxR C-terminal-related transcriptional regulator [Enterobacter bugandensis]MCU6159180.1 LuxR C-terminal-related transcriptional regulator [Enterobacter bugandensis]MCU6214732.1 LuxR C-terminal-related transcriptional regulator [Enterobacter bugandensis]
MLNILIKESDLLFQYGLQVFLTDLFQRGFREEVQFSSHFNHQGVSVADIVVLSLCVGEVFTCIPELQSRKKGIVIGLVDDESREAMTPSCFEDIILISRRASISKIREIIYFAWYKTQLPGYRWNKNACLDCHHKKLSPQQVRIMASFYKGLSVMEIAHELNISDKTVFTHKYMLMQKFDLRTDYELIMLLNRLAEKNGAPNFFRDSLDMDIKEYEVAASSAR